MIILGVRLTDFTSKETMESKGWSFNWNDENVFASGDERCKRVPKNSYCGYRKDGQGTISYTFRNGSSGVATLRYGQSSDKGSVSITKNDIVMESRNTRGDSKISLEYAAFDVLQIDQLGESVINIHSLTLDIIGMFNFQHM